MTVGLRLLSSLHCFLSAMAPSEQVASHVLGPSRRASFLIVLAVVTALALGVAGCGAGESDDPTSSPTAEPTSGEMTTALAFFLHGEKVASAERRVPATQAVARAAMEALCGGVDDFERAAGLTILVPMGTKMVGSALDKGTATVDLSRDSASRGGTLSMTSRVSQVVYTLTQFRTIDCGGVQVGAHAPHDLLDQPVFDHRWTTQLHDRLHSRTARDLGTQSPTVLHCGRPECTFIHTGARRRSMTQTRPAITVRTSAPTSTASGSYDAKLSPNSGSSRTAMTPSATGPSDM